MRRSFIDILNIIGFLIVLAVVVFAAYSLFIDKPFFEPESYFNNESDGSIYEEGNVSGTYSSDKEVKSVIAGNVSGLIEVETWDGNEVQLNYEKKGPGKPPEVKIALEGDVLTIKAVYPKSIGNFGSVNFLLRVPKDLDYLKAGSVSGRIKVSGLGDETEQVLSSTSGSVSTDSAGDLEISSVSGSLTFSSSGKRVSASTTSGRIEGTINDASNTEEIEISSVSGRITLKLPSNIDADVDLRSVSGSVSSDLPVSVTKTKKNSLSGVIGRGGVSIDMSTVSGAVTIYEL